MPKSENPIHTMNNNVIFAAQYAAPYEGNFIKSLKALELKLQQKKNCCVTYVFPEKAKEQPWIKRFCDEHQVCFTDDDVRSREAIRQLRDIFRELQPRLVHTHFDGYDVSVLRAGAKCPVVWHLRDWFTLMPNVLKNLYQRLMFFRQFGYYARPNVRIVAVCADLISFVGRYGFSQSRVVCIPNGIDISRFTPPR